MQTIGAVYTQTGTIVPSKSEGDSLLSDGYGFKHDSQVFLSPLETLFLLENNKISIVDEITRNLVHFNELFNEYYHEDNELWSKYIVFKDIRERGFTIKTADNKFGFQVYERGTYQKKPPSYFLYILNEGSSETISNLKEILNKSIEYDMKLKLAVIDRRGEIVYYSLDIMDFNHDLK